MQHRELTRIVFNLMNYLFIAAANFVVSRCKRVYLFSNVFEQAEMCNQKKKPSSPKSTRLWNSFGYSLQMKSLHKRTKPSYQNEQQAPMNHPINNIVIVIVFVSKCTFPQSEKKTLRLSFHPLSNDLVDKLCVRDA